MSAIEQQINQLEQPYALLTVGVPGSGKSTILGELQPHIDAIRISPDDIREELTGDTMSQHANRSVFDLVHERAEAALQNGDSIIIDATHASGRFRPETVAMYRSFGAEAVAALFINTPLDVALERNAKRDRVVPNNVIERMAQNLEDTPVSVAEGFDIVIEIDHSS